VPHGYLDMNGELFKDLKLKPENLKLDFRCGEMVHPAVVYALPFVG
jgi:hypothetical protein